MLGHEVHKAHRTEDEEIENMTSEELESWREILLCIAMTCITFSQRECDRADHPCRCRGFQVE